MSRSQLLSCFYILFLAGLSAVWAGCEPQQDDAPPPLFERLSPAQTGVDFRNELQPTEEFNMYIFRNFYNGGGVAAGDLSGNGRPDLFFTGNMVSNRLYINIDWDRYVNVGDYIVAEGYRVIDPEQNSDVYNDMFLKRYLTALLKRQWGVNLKKFEGMELPGGVTLNGQQMFDEATEEIRQTEEEMQLKYEYPIDFHIG